LQYLGLKSRTLLRGGLNNSILVIVLGAMGILGIMQWTSYAVGKHVKIASLFLFPATLDSQKADSAFERMNRQYNNAVLTQEKKALGSADIQAVAATAALADAAKSMRFNPARQAQIATLQQAFAHLHLQSQKIYATAADVNGVLPKREDLANLSRENRSVQLALDTLQSDLVGDFRGELALIDRLQSMQEILAALVLVGVTVGMYFRVRSMIRFTVRMREDEILRQVHSDQVNERNMLRALIDNIPYFMYVKDVQSRFVVANRYLARVVGADTPEALQGKTDFDYYPLELASAFYEDEQRVILSGQPLHNREEKGRDIDGNEIDILTTKVPIHDANEQLIGIAGIGRDISASKKLEEALREAELKYRGIFDKAIIGIYQSTPDGRFLSVNPSMAFTFCYESPEEMIASITNIPTQLFVSAKRGVEFMLVMDKVGGVKNFECEVFRKDRSKIWVTMSIRAIRKNGAVIRYEGMCEDCTERTLLREQLLQAQKLESVGQLASGIAHEINTPIQYIGDNVRFLMDAFDDITFLLKTYERLRLEAKTNILFQEIVQEVEAAVKRADTAYLMEEIPKAIEQTLEGVSRVSTLVNAMKEFSHPGTKEKILLDLNHAITSTITVARNEWKYVADLTTDLDQALPPVLCLPGEFNQVILNLIVNAAHAIAEAQQKYVRPEKGQIVVQTICCVDWAEIRVQDTGSGIPENIRGRIFDPFFTTKEIGKGTGQGLSIARSVIVDKHGGSIHFETEEGKGTTFIIRLPRNGKTLSATEVTV